MIEDMLKLKWELSESWLPGLKMATSAGHFTRSRLRVLNLRNLTSDANHSSKKRHAAKMVQSEKKQQTLSSFFKKPIASTPSKPVPPRVATPDDDEDIQPPNPKRRKVTPEVNGLTVLTEVEEDDEPRDTLKPVSGNGQPPRTPKAAAGDRTSRYIFDSSPQQENRTPESESESEKARKQALHRKFVKKLGKPDSIAEIKRRNRLLDSNDDEPGEEDGDEEPDEAPKPKGKAAGKKGGSKLTPMEKQVIDIKKAHMDTLLVVEVGYKFRFFGEDARIAARELSIVCIPGKMRFDEHPSEAHLDRFASASIPVHRLHVHVKRLVAAGHKVGVVRQLETAALKAVGDNRNAPFVRKLTNLYTKGTYIDDIEGLEEEAGSPPPMSPSTGFLLCMTEVNSKGYGNDEKVHVGIVAVQPATGDIIYDDFEDGFMRTEIETRLLHIAPCEFLVVGDLSKASEKLVQHLSGSKTNVFGDKMRIERVPKHKTMAAEAHNHISNFYANKLKESQTDDGKSSKILDKIMGLPEHVTVCLSAMINHLTEYGLQDVFDLHKYFQPFSARSHMLLNGNTLTSLEIYQNQTDHTTKGSLFWTLDRTLTKFGARLLRKWVGRPLLDRSSIEARLSAVEELLDSGKADHVEKLRSVLMRLRTDLEKSLIRIYYGKCTRPELLNVLQALQYLANEYSHITSSTTGFESPLISSALVSLPTILTEVLGYLKRINRSAAKDNDKYAFFLDAYETEDISDHKHGIASVEHDLDMYRSTASEILGRKTPVTYTTSSQIEYLIELDNQSASIKKVPASWAKISGTKKVSRFHPPEVIKLMRERDQHKESLAAACDEAFKDLLSEISQKYQLFRDTIQNLAVLDCLLSLANVASQSGYVRPTFTDGTKVNVIGGRHPMIEQLLLDSYVPNDINLSNAQDETRALLVTGPNMGGKSSYVRSVALICILAQLGSYVPAESAELGVLDAVFTRMGAMDNVMAGESTFMVELSETSDILKLSSERSLVVLDELGRGTSTSDGMAIAGSVLDFLVREKRCLTLFITHYQNLARMESSFADNELKNVHMRFQEEDGDRVTFLYEVGEGVAHRSYGLNVARLANVSERVIGVAGEKSRELEGLMRGRRMRGVARVLSLEGGNGFEQEEEAREVLERVVEGIEAM
jgi:DNA mismatch repair protein MSH3